MPEPIQTPDEGTEPKEQVTPQADPEIETPQTPGEVETPQPAIEPTTPEPQPQPQTDFKEKFVHSQRESILNAERVKAANARIESLTKQDTPTDEAMRGLYPEWDNLDEYNKRVLIRQETIAMQNAATRKEQQDLAARLKLEDEVDSVLDDPKFSKLKGREAEFKRFALKPANRGLSAEVIAKAFLFDAEDETPTPTPPKPMPTEALPTGSGGPRTPLKPKKISFEESEKIRKTDYKRWKELLDADAFEELE